MSEGNLGNLIIYSFIICTFMDKFCFISSDAAIIFFRFSEPCILKQTLRNRPPMFQFRELCKRNEHDLQTFLTFCFRKPNLQLEYQLYEIFIYFRPHIDVFYITACFLHCLPFHRNALPNFQTRRRQSRI